MNYMAMKAVNNVCMYFRIAICAHELIIITCIMHIDIFICTVRRNKCSGAYINIYRYHTFITAILSMLYSSFKNLSTVRARVRSGCLCIFYRHCNISNV
jgi:hypothetical protein